MANFASISRTELAERRKRLRRQRQLKALQAIWRSLAVMGLAAGVVWAATSPIWVIYRADQVAIEGNQHLDAATVQAMLPITYPQSLWAVQPQAIAQQLQSRAPIANVTVTRRLFPPSLTVRIQERHPVAIADLASTHFDMGASPTSNPTATPKVVLLDAEGTWIPLDNYTSLNQTLELPKLKVLGMKDQYRSQWKALYQVVSRSPVQVASIDWRNPANLILTTDLGTVYIGASSDHLQEQLQILDQMRQLPDGINRNQIAYIDLRNPAEPSIQMLQTAETPEPSP